MPKFKFVKKARRRGRRRARRNMPFQIRRGGRGRFAQSGGTLIARFPKSKRSKTKSGKRRKSSGVSAGAVLKAFKLGTAAAKPKKRRSSKKAKRKSNPGRRRRTSGRRRRNARTTVIQLLGGGRKRRRGRRRGRRNNPLKLRRSRRRYRRNPGFGLSLGSGVGFVKSLFSKDTAVLVGGGTAGLSASLWGPKLAGHLLYAPLGRGWGGVATSVVTTGLVSGLVSRFVGQRAGQAVLAGGLIGAFAQALSAINCNWRTQILPLETSLLACALPTVPSGGVAAQLMAAGVPANQAKAIAMQSGMKDYVKQGQLRDYVVARNGMRDYVDVAASRGSGSLMDSSGESF